jgi:hypothetical protein
MARLFPFSIQRFSASTLGDWFVPLMSDCTPSVT